MDFFEQQDKARKKTVQLVLLFLLGLVATLIVINIICFIGFWLLWSPEQFSAVSTGSHSQSVLFSQFIEMTGYQATPSQNRLLNVWQAWWSSNLNWQISMGVLVAVLIGTLFRYLELAGGGRKVAQWAGAIPIEMNTRLLEQKQLLNICEEMAIAAGMPVPEVYIMAQEKGINAFVAGYSVDQAVLVVTKGALDHLTRDQLQGVIGHEYSHILNGDMRLNIRLMSLLAGLVMIGQIGRFLLHSSFSSTHRSHRSRDGRLAVGLAAIGLVFAGVGYIGVLVGRMIKAAVSRQREFLADASSVQFTRNPDGLAGALYEIQALSGGSQLIHHHAEDMSHLCFGETVALSDRLATHPPVLERIRRISPNFVAKERSRRRKDETAQSSVSRSQPKAFDQALAAATLTALVGQVTPDHVNYARNLYQNIPEQVKIWVHQSQGAKAYLYCQVLLGTGDMRQSVLDTIKKEDPSVLASIQQIWPYCQKMDEQLRQPILELAIPTLKRMLETERVIFIDRLERLIELDGRVDFIEWITLTLTKRRLALVSVNRSNSLDNKIAPYFNDLQVLFNVLVELNPDKQAAEAAQQAVCQRLGMECKPNQTLREVGYDRVGAALQALENVNFMWRKVILQGCADIVESDGAIGFREYEIMRVVAECLDCPMPLLMVGAGVFDERDIPIPFG